MIKLAYILGTFSFFFIASCDIAKSKSEITQDPKSRFDLKTYLDSSKKGYPIEIIRVDLTPDKIPDYFVIAHSGISLGHFFDGKTDMEIPIGGNYYPWSRPGVELEYEIVDLNCNDNQEEIMVKGGSGGTAGLTISSEIYSFDPMTKTMKKIFEGTNYGSYADVEGNDIPETINAIELNFDSCLLSISVCEGRYQKKRASSLTEEIVPIKKGTVTKYRFDSTGRKFVLVN